MHPVLGPLTPLHHPQPASSCSGPAALATAVTALDPNPEPWRDLVVALWQAATGQGLDAVPADARELLPGELCLAALMQGYHVRLAGDGPAAAMDQALATSQQPAERVTQRRKQAHNEAQGAGLLVVGDAPSESHVIRGLEAGHPFLLLTDASRRHDDREPRPHWVTLVGIDDQALLVHDPLAPGGPEEELLSRLPALSGYQGCQALIELAPGNRLRR